MGNLAAKPSPGGITYTQDAANDPLTTLLNNLSTPPSTTTTQGDTGALSSIIAQLQKSSTPQGSADLIKQIYARGTEQALPGIVNNLNVGGARSGTSSYQALAINDMNARLAGTASEALTRNAQAAAQAAAQLAAANSTQTTTRGSKSVLQSILYPAIAKAASAKLQSRFSPNIVTNNQAVATDITDSLTGFSNGYNVEGAISNDPADIASSLYSTGSALDNPGDATMLLDTTSANYAGDYASAVAAQGEELTVGQTEELYQQQVDAGITGDSSQGKFGLGSMGEAAAINAGLRLATTGKLDKAGLYASSNGAVDAALMNMIPGGQLIEIASMLGNPVASDITGLLASGTGEILGGLGDAVGSMVQDIGNLFGL